MSELLYQHKDFAVYLSHDACAVGHILVVPSAPLMLEQLSHQQVSAVLHAASVCSSMLFDGLQAHGTNMIVCNGPVGNLTSDFTDRFVVHVIARFQDDKLGLMWQPKPGDRAQIAVTASKLAGSMLFGDEPKPEKITMPAHMVEQKTEPDVKLEVGSEKKPEPKPEKDYRFWNIFRKFS